MQDKILFAAGLVALFIGLFIGIRTDNASKKIEDELAAAKRQVVSLEQQVATEQTKRSTLDRQLQSAQRQLSVVEKKLDVSSSWYGKMQDVNRNLTDDVYHIRLSLVEVLDILPARQNEAMNKIRDLMGLLDEHHALTGEKTVEQAEEPAVGTGEQATTAPAQEGTEAAPAPEKKEEAAVTGTEAAPVPEKKEEPAVTGEEEKGAQAEEMEKAAQSATDQQKPQVNEQAGEKEKPAEEKTPEKPAEPEKVHL